MKKILTLATFALTCVGFVSCNNGTMHKKSQQKDCNKCDKCGKKGK